MYNEASKIKFLSQFNEFTSESYKNILEACTPFEEQKEKDVADFNSTELYEMLQDMGIISENMAVLKPNSIHVIKKYVEYELFKNKR